MQIGLPIAWSHKTKFINQGHWSNCEQSPESAPPKLHEIRLAAGEMLGWFPAPVQTLMLSLWRH